MEYLDNMDDIENKTNNELLFEVKTLEQEFEALKTKILNDYDKLEGIENRYNRINKLIQKRLKG